jgi:hypothetical protein
MRRARSRRLSGLALGAGVSVLALFALGCPTAADLANPQDYPAPMATAGTGTSGSGGGSAGGATGGGVECETACMTAMISGNTCKVCHGKAPLFGSMDLETPGYTTRLKDHAAEHQSLDASMCPPGQKVIDLATPANSLLLLKVEGQVGTCGTVMPPPPTPQISAADLQCVKDYIACATGSAAPAGGGSGSGGSATAGAPSGGTPAGGGTTSGGSGGTGGV